MLFTASQPDDDTSLPAESPRSPTKLNQGDDTLLITLPLVAGACLSSTERKVAFYWSAEGFTRLHSCDSRSLFEGDTVDATNVANQTVHGRRARGLLIERNRHFVTVLSGDEYCRQVHADSVPHIAF